ncbi:MULTISPECIES: ribonuclease E/G [Asticcacaulis]|uniref:ribonuclease E/G n=1 Tax=Asticcacaulis TaxID=76890 RepID=UPI001AE369C8|nr:MULTISPECIES: ribonuclease E/G [Asticcacaulis]MBP2160700.1 hypothetical protein [Asticcacaulis solisilvae]MDR6801745.1 hypothetical protein [Asticcacaulis sp. BE141]
MITLHYESRFGLARGAVYKDGLPQLYAEGLEHDPSVGVLGTRSVARLKKRAGGMLFLALAGGEDAVLEGPQAVLDKLTEGAAVEVEITAENRGDSYKLARARFQALADGAPRRLLPALSLKDRLLAQVHHLIGDGPVTMACDREAIKAAYDHALDPNDFLSPGGFMSIEPTNALIACDVDSSQGESSLAATPRTVAKACNEAAVGDLPRRLRLSGYAGLVVVDLIGKRHDFDKLKALLLKGFAAEAPRIVLAPIGKFGTLEFIRPWGACPLGEDYAMDRKALHWLYKAVELSEQDHSRIIVMRLRADDIAVLKPLIAASLDPLAPMLRLETTTTKPEVFAL